MKKIVLLGCGGHAKSVVDTIEQKGTYEIVGFLDPKGLVQNIYKKYNIIGTDQDLEELFKKEITYGFITVGYMGESKIRNQLFRKMKDLGFTIPNIIEETSSIANDVQLGEGIYVGKNAVINSNSLIGDMCIINTHATIEHDCIIGAYTHMAVSSVACGGVIVGANSFVGANATIIQNITLGEHVLVGAGAVVTRDIKEKTKYFEKREKIYE